MKEKPSSKFRQGAPAKTLANDPGVNGVICPVARSQEEFKATIEGLNHFFRPTKAKTS
jgi:hypothetical protein